MKLHQVSLPARDLEASVDFYRRLGLRLIVHAPPRYARFETPSGETLSLHRVADGEPAATEERVLIYFEVDDVDRVYEELRERGIDFETGPEDMRWLWREARFHDPAGNRLCLFHAGENRRFPPWRIE